MRPFGNMKASHKYSVLMRLSLAIPLLIVSTLHVGAMTFGQTFVLKKENTRVEQLFNELHRQTGYNVFYDEAMLPSDTRISVSYKGASIETVMKDIADKYQLSYTILGKDIILSRRKETPSPTTFSTEAPTDIQQRTISGRVTDEQGQPLSGVTIREVGQENGSATNADGRFSLQLLENEATLRFSLLGYITKEIKVESAGELAVRLSIDIYEVDEVVVVGYGTQKKVNLSGAVETVSAKQLADRPTNNVGLALQGIVPNLSISPNGGQANATPTFNIRGITSLNGGVPLFLVDGVPTDAADFSRMNAADIENISILKDASSAAIYGSRAAYGVVLVTTKKGTTENLVINYGSFLNVRRNGRMPEVVLDPYIQTSYKQIMGQPWYNLYSEQEIAYTQMRKDDPSLPNVIPSYTDPEQWAYFAETDWYHELFHQNAVSTSNNINVSGKSDKASYYVGAEYYTENGMLKYNTDKYRKYNVRSNIDYKPTEWLTIGNNTSIQNYTYDRPTGFGPWVFGTAHKVNSLLPINNPDGSWTIAKEGSTILGNIVGAMENGGETKTTNYVIQTQFNSNVALIKDIWNLKADLTLKYATNKERGWDSDKNIPYKTGPNIEPQYFGFDNYAQVANYARNYTLANVYSDFSKRLGQHTISILAGFSQELERYEYNLLNRKDLILDSYPTVQLATGEMTVNEDIYEWAIRSGFFRLNYSFKDRYIVEANGRMDGSSRFPKNDRYGLFPSFSAAWVISNEAFFEPLSNHINHMKVRASYGSLGNQDVSYYQYIATMSASKMALLLNGERPMGVYAPGLVSQSLTWEKVNTANLGLDLNLLSNRLLVSADIYRRQTKDMLMKGKTLPNVLGTAEPKINAADLETKGWETSIAWRDQFNMSKSPFQYGLRFIISDSKAHITKFDNPTGYLDDYYVGQEFGEIWGMQTEGFFKDAEDIKNHADQWEVTSYPGDRPIEPGDMKYKDLNNDGEINRGDWTLANPGDFKVIGNSSSRYNFGLNFDAEWNGFDIRMLVQGVMKRDWYPSGYKFWGIYLAPWGNVLEHNLDHWTPENPDAYFPRLKSYLANGAGDLAIPQTKYLQNAAYARLKNITIGYTLPSAVFRKIGLQRCRLYVSGENLFEYTPLTKTHDPESLNESEHPFQRTLSFGLNISL